MTKGTIRIFSVFSIIFFLCLSGWFVFRVITVRSDNIRAAERSYKIIQGELSVLHKLGLGIDPDTLRDRFEDLNRRHPPLKALTIYSESSGIYFLKAEESRYYSSESLGSFESAGAPVYTVKPASFLLLRNPLPFSTGVEDIEVDGLYEILGKRDIYPPLLICLILLAIYLIMTALFLLLFKPEPRNYPAAGDTAVRPVKKEPEREKIIPEKKARKQDNPPDTGDIHSPETGLLRRSFLNERLDNELKRAASFDQDLVLGLIGLSSMQESFNADTFVQLLLERFPFSDLAFEYNAGGFAVIIPNSDLNQGIVEFEGLLTEIEKTNGTTGAVTPVGLSSRNGRLMDAVRLIKEADKALQKASCEQKSTIIAFRTDPSKYREFIASRI